MACRRSSCLSHSPNLVRTHPREHYQALRDSTPCLLRAATVPKGTKLELLRGAHLGTPSSASRTAAASQPISRIAKTASWLYLLRISPALHPPGRPFHYYKQTSFGQIFLSTALCCVKNTVLEMELCEGTANKKRKLTCEPHQR